MQSPNSRIRKAGIALSAVALFGLVGCSSSSDAGSSSEAPDAGGKEYTIALVLV